MAYRVWVLSRRATSYNPTTRLHASHQAARYHAIKDRLNERPPEWAEKAVTRPRQDLLDPPRGRLRPSRSVAQ